MHNSQTKKGKSITKYTTLALLCTSHLLPFTAIQETESASFFQVDQFFLVV